MTGPGFRYGLFTGYSKLIKRLDYIEPWYWNYDRKTDRWLFNAAARPGPLRGEMADWDLATQVER